MDHHEVPTPRTLVVHRDNVERILSDLGFPCILKKPDSSFSQGVVKVDDEGNSRVTSTASWSDRT